MWLAAKEEKEKKNRREREGDRTQTRARRSEGKRGGDDDEKGVRAHRIPIRADPRPAVPRTADRRSSLIRRGEVFFPS